jgi:hypothetical protein
MPKDATKNVDRYKVRGGHLNEYDFEKEKAADRKQTTTAAMPKQKVDKTHADKSPKH